MVGYKFRAECVNDVRLAIGRLNSVAVANGLSLSNKSRAIGAIDQEVEIETDIPVDLILRTIREVPDSHVMIETFATKEEYSGERTYQDKAKLEVDRDG